MQVFFLIFLKFFSIASICPWVYIFFIILCAFFTLCLLASGLASGYNHRRVYRKGLIHYLWNDLLPVLPDPAEQYTVTRLQLFTIQQGIHTLLRRNKTPSKQWERFHATLSFTLPMILRLVKASVSSRTTVILRSVFTDWSCWSHPQLSSKRLLILKRQRHGSVRSQAYSARSFSAHCSPIF